MRVTWGLRMEKSATIVSGYRTYNQQNLQDE